MASVPITPVHCSAAAEKPFSRLLRLVGTALLAAQALLLTAVGVLGSLGPGYRAGDALFAATGLALLAVTLWSFRDPSMATRWLFLPSLAAFVALFFTSYAHRVGSSTVGTAGTTNLYSPTLTLAGVIFMCMVLSRFLRWSATKAACNCG